MARKNTLQTGWAALHDRLAGLQRSRPRLAAGLLDDLAALHEATETAHADERARVRRALRAERAALRQTENELRLLRELAKIIALAPTVDTAMSRTLEHVCAATGWAYGEAWLPDDERDVLVDSPMWHAPGDALNHLQQLANHGPLAAGESLPGRVWASGKPEWLEDVRDLDRFARAHAARKAGLRSGVGVPILSGARVVAVLVFLIQRRSAVDEHLLDLVLAAVGPLGPVIENRRAQEELERLNRELEQRVARRTAELERVNRELREGILERTRTAEALRASSARRRAVLDNVSEGIVTIDERAVIESFNKAAERMFGYQAEEVVGRNVSLLMPSPYHEEHDAYLENYLRTGERKIIGIGREVSAVRRDGTVFPAELSVDEFLDGEQRLFTGVLRDITRRKRSEAEVNRRREDHARMIRLAIMGEMATALAHELNQPLHAISAYAHAGIRLMQAGNNTPEKLVYALEQAAGQAQRAGDIIRRIRSYVRRTEGSKVPLQINALVRQVAGFLAAELRDQRISIELELDEALPGVPGDELQIEQVLLNLMRNAMEAMLSAHRRVLTLSTAPESGGGVRVSVRDSGPGIEPEALARIFEPFYTSKVDGTGMGLAISRTLVESWEGSLWAESEPGRGACFHFTVPGDGTPPAHDDAAASA